MKLTNLNQCLIILMVTFLNTVSCEDFPRLLHIRSKTPPDVQAKAVQELIKRLIPERSTEFVVKINVNIGPATGKDTFQLVSLNSQLQITGTNGVAAAAGFHYFLKYFCGCHIAWSGTQLNIPKPLPKLNSPLNITSQDRFRYYLNVCTPSYSMVWWDWSRWEQEIDWMALNGINLPLAIGGQEILLKKVFIQLGFTEEDLNQFFAGPAFQAWGRMGNIQGWGGPLPPEWLYDQMQLQLKIIKRMRELGMTPVLPGFAGFVPSAITRLFPNASYTKLNSWNNFTPQFCCLYVLDPQDPLFIKIGSNFITELINLYGTDHIYNVDTFNENKPKSSDTKYLAALGRIIYQTLTTADPQAIWLMQGWLFQDTSFWKKEQAKALLTSIPKGSMIVLDLFSEVNPQYNRLESYFGQPFIWCMLHNFGGTIGLYGAINQINSAVFEGRTFPNSTMIGTGLTMEGIFQNEVMYELMNEMAWRSNPVNLTQWIREFSIRRYGIENEDVINAWQYLKNSVYNCSTHYADHGKYIFTSRPSLNLQEIIWYPIKELLDALLLFSKASLDDIKLDQNPLFVYDLIDVSREVIARLLPQMYNWAVISYKQKDLNNLQLAISNFTTLIDNLHKMLASNKHFRLANWIDDAKARGATGQLKKLYEYNARNQITLWGPNGEILDYASKQWDKTVSDYYKGRWTLFFKGLLDSMKSGKPFDQNAFNTQVFNTVEKPFTQKRSLTRNVKTSQKYGKTSKIIKEILDEYYWLISNVENHDYFKSSLERSSNYFKSLHNPKLSAMDISVTT